MDFLKVENLSKKFGAFNVLKNVLLTIPEKTIVLLMGPNGSGKTTLINCISGVYRPDGGRIWFNGMNITGKELHEIVKLGLGRSFQIPGPFKKLTVGENLLVCGQNQKGENFSTSIFHRIWDKQEKELVEKLYKIIQQVDLEHQINTLAGELSGGQLKLLELGRLLMLDSKLMLLDEPIGGINPVLAHKILSQIQKIRTNFGTSFLLVEHRLDIVMQYVDYVYVLAEGNIKCEGSPKEVLNRKELYEIYL
ncbi:MAG: ABC transporter ATP-binding protein [Candidatus Hodarchaeota archaeon]